LARTHHVIAPDLPGFGRSDKSKRKYNVPFYVETIIALMDVLEIDKATLIGNSLVQ
jgi:pimeloyl-ACP methyl ester carboxylesterase